MPMQKAGVFFFIVCFGLLILPLTAQEEEDPDSDRGPPIDSDWSLISESPYAKGDKTFNISIGILIPTVFVGDSGIISHNLNVVGGTGSLAYSYFLTSGLYIGGELGGMFISTLGNNMLYIVPFGFRIGYQFVLNRFTFPSFLSFMNHLEFPFTLTVGGAFQSYLANEATYIGFFMKPGVSAFFRFSQSWSFGINTAWWWVPEWTRDSAKDVHGNFLEITASARYHF